MKTIFTGLIYIYQLYLKHKKYMNTIGEKIKKIRELKNYTQEHIAVQIGITQAGYSKIERGESDIPISKLYEIAKVLDVKMEDILLFDQHKFFNSFNNANDNTIDSISLPSKNDKMEKLYEDKITVLEKLLQKTEDELSIYKAKYDGK
jgi:transcriptional regulator with XRE-family HTH domain